MKACCHSIRSAFLITLLLVQCNNAVANQSIDTCNNDNSQITDDPKAHLHQKLIKWIQSSGGIINEKQEIRLQDPLNPTSGLGIFAVERIEEGEVLCMIPNDLMVQPAEEIKEISQFNCETIRILIDTMEQGEESSSKFASYVNYLRTMPRGQLPETWSETGFQALCDIFQLEDRSEWNMRMTDFLPSWYDECEGIEGNDLHEHLAMQVVLRSEDDLMIPFYDMYNHRNGDWFNTRQNFFDDYSLELSARRTIEAGEQIYNSYNMCDACGGRKKSFFGTFELFKFYGFVEQMPQRWRFLEYPDVAFDLDDKKDNSGLIELTWATSVKPNLDMLEFMLEEVDRIAQLGQSLGEKQSSSSGSLIPDNEWDVIMQYLNAHESALSHAINATKKLFISMGVDGWNHDDWEAYEAEKEDEEDDSEDYGLKAEDDDEHNYSIETEEEEGSEK